MRDSPAEGPTSNDPGGLRARPHGHKVEVRTHEGELIRIVNASVGDELVRAGLAENSRYGVRLKLGIGWQPPRLDRSSGCPDLEQMRRKEPGRYASLWRGTHGARTGKGALGRQIVDHSVVFAAQQSSR
jgi:hypothetical protein